MPITAPRCLSLPERLEHRCELWKRWLAQTEEFIINITNDQLPAWPEHTPDLLGCTDRIREMLKQQPCVGQVKLVTLQVRIHHRPFHKANALIGFVVQVLLSPIKQGAVDFDTGDRAGRHKR